MSAVMREPEGVTRLKAGRYSMICTGPDGVIFSLSLDMERRSRLECALDDERLQELLVLTSLASGMVESELHRGQGSYGGMENGKGRMENGNGEVGR